MRLRPSALLQVEGKNFLIDVGPDFRQQALRHKINHLDGLILTHTHYDHVAGLDELRIYYYMQKKPLPCLLSSDTLEELKIRYHYFLPPSNKDETHDPKLSFQVLESDRGSTLFEGLPLSYVSYIQLGMKVNGFRWGSFAYVVDLFTYEEEIIEPLKGVETLVLNGLRWSESRAHLSIPKALEFGEKVGAKKIYLTHIAHEADHDEVSQKLPSHAHLCYDGLTIEI